MIIRRPMTREKRERSSDQDWRHDNLNTQLEFSTNTKTLSMNFSGVEMYRVSSIASSNVNPPLVSRVSDVSERIDVPALIFVRDPFCPSNPQQPWLDGCMVVQNVTKLVDLSPVHEHLN